MAADKLLVTRSLVEEGRMITEIEYPKMTACQMHCNLAEAHHILAERPSPITGEGWDLIGRAMGHIRSQMSALSTVILWGGQ